MTPPTLGLAIIVRDEAAMLPGLLASIDGAFDQVALVDTGSTDRTVAIFEAWAQRQALPFGYRVDRIAWGDDFAAARNHADALLETDWTCNADADDEIRGAGNLRALAATLPAGAVTVAFAWDYFDGGVLWRARMARRAASRWCGRVHETLLADGPTVNVPPQLATWFHRRRDERPDAHARDLSIARRWAREAPDDPHALVTAATAEIEDGDPCEAVMLARRFLALERVRRELGDTHADACAALDQLAALPALGDRRELLPYLAAALAFRPPATWASLPVPAAGERIAA